MNFDSPNSVLTELNSMLIAQQLGAENRVKVQRLFNGETPYTPEEARDQNIRTNVNFLEATRIAQNATNQLNNSIFKSSIFFKVLLEKGPSNKRAIWGDIITKYVNQELKRCRAYRCARESANAQLVLHGPGPLVWRDNKCPVPDDIGIEDVLVPAGTYCSMKNLDRFAIRVEMTWGELYDATKGKNADSGWDKGYVTALLASLFEKGLQPVYQGNRWLFPEKLAEDIKEGFSTSASSSLAKMLGWNFFYRNKKSGKWTRKMVIDPAGVVGDQNFSETKSNAMKEGGFLYVKEDYAESWQEIIHWYIGNCSNVAPYRYWSMRSMGYLLYGPCFTSNKTECRLIDHMMQALLTLFRNVSDDNREKLQMIDLQNFGVVPDGVSWVPANERHSVDWQLVVSVRNQMRELMSESSSSFVPDAGGESGPAMTATETMVRQNTSVSLTSAVLNQIGDQSVYEYREICRRFCIKDNPDPMAKRFRENIKADGVPLEMLDIEKWEVIPEQTVGGGNKSVELNITQALMNEFLPTAGPEGQRIVMRRRYNALTDNPDESLLVVPDPPAPASDDIQYAQSRFPILMMLQPVQIAEGINLATYCAMLLTMADSTLNQTQSIMQSPESLSTAANNLAGVSNIISHCEEQIQIIARDKRQEQKAKLLFKQAAQMMGMVQQLGKAVMAAEQQKAQQQNPQVDPKTQAKIQDIALTGETNRQIKAQDAEQKRQLKQIQWQEENQRKNANTQADINRKGVQTHADVAAKDLTTRADILREAAATRNGEENNG